MADGGRRRGDMLARLRAGRSRGAGSGTGAARSRAGNGEAREPDQDQGRRRPASNQPSAAPAVSAASAASGQGARAATGPVGPAQFTDRVASAHRDAALLVERSPGAASGQADPRLSLLANDVAVAELSAHLATMDHVIYPELARRLPDARDRVARLRAGAGEMMSIMRGIEQWVQGDRNRPAASVAELRADLARALDQHVELEESLLREFAAAAPASDLARLEQRYERLLRHAPTRPHPHLQRRHPLGGRVGFRLVSWFDDVLDTMDSRAVAGTPVRSPARVGLWGAWLLGRPPVAQTEPSRDTKPSRDTEPPGETQPSGRGTAEQAVGAGRGGPVRRR